MNKISGSNNQIKWGAVLSYGQLALSIIVGVIYTPLMIRILGKNEYGLYNTVASTISMLSILGLGFNSSYIRFYSRCKKDNIKDSVAKLNGMYLLLFSVIGLTALICGVFISFNLELVFADGLTAGEYEIARVLSLLLTFNLAVAFPMTTFSNIISAHEKFVFLKIVGMIKTVLGPLVTFPLLLLGYGSIGMVSVTVSVSLIADVIYLYFVFVKLKEKFIFSGFNKKLWGSLFSFTFFIALNLIVNEINWNIDKMILGRFQGTAVVAVYSVGYCLYTYYQMFSTSVSGVFTPKVHRLVVSTEDDPEIQRKELTGLMAKVGRIQFFILLLLATGVVFFGKAFIGFWVGAGYEGSYAVALLLIIPATISLIQNVGIEIQRAKNKHKFRSIAYFIMAILNLLMSVALCQTYGAAGCAFGTAVSVIFANGLIMNIYYYKKCNIDIPYFWKEIGKASRGLIIPIIVGTLILVFVPMKNLLILAVSILVYSVIYCLSVYFFGMNRYEKSLTTGFFKRKP